MLTGRENLTPREAAQISPITLAFVGDAVYSLYVRERLTLDVGGKTAQLQRASIKTVSAKGQSAFMDKLLPALTEEETDVFRRGKNAKKATKSKSASSLEYSRSTGFEAVIGYLYLLGRTERLQELFALSVTEDFIAEEEVKPFKPVHR
jgi:ribonuclease-3 family protein